MRLKRSIPAATRRAAALFGAALLACVLLAAAAQAGAQNLPIPGLAAGEEPTPVPLPAPVKQPERPLVLIAEVATEPEPVSPGEPFILRLKVKNYGSRQARRIVLTLQSLEGETTLKHFSPLGQSNTLYLDRLPVGAENWLQCKLIAGPDLSGGIYNLVLHFSYINSDGDPYEATAVTGLIVEPQCTLDLVEVKYPRSVTEGETFTASGYVVNNGGVPVRGVGVAVREDKKFLAEQGETFSAPLTKEMSMLLISPSPPCSRAAAAWCWCSTIATP